MFSDLSKDYNDSQKLGLNNTLDVAALTKLRRLFGNEQMIRDYRTSEEHSIYHNNPEFDPNDISDNLENRLRPEILQEDLMIDYDLNPRTNMPINLIFNSNEPHRNEQNEEFMATSDLIKLFTSEGAHKTIEPVELRSDEKGHTQTLFDKNPFKDFTMTKIQEVLNDKDTDQVQELYKAAVDYRATVENKLLNKLETKESPRMLKSKRRDIEKWVSKELRDVQQETDDERIRQKTIKIICETNVHTERIFNLLQRLNTTESMMSSQQKQEKLFEKNTIEDLLKTDSDNSPRFDLNEHSTGKHLPLVDTDEKDNSESNKKSDKSSSNEISDNSSSNKRISAKGSNKNDEVDVLETTQELLNFDFDKILANKDTIIEPSPREDNKDLASEKEAESVVTFRPKQISGNKDLEYLSDTDNEEIIATEVNLTSPPSLSPRKDEVTEDDKLMIAENILSTLVREIQEYMFPLRQEVHEEHKTIFDSKYSEKAVFHIKPLPDQLEKGDIEDSKDDDISDSINDEENEIMMNFNIMRNFEMRRSRAEKNHYDNQIFVSYMNEVFSAIKSKAFLFLKAFSKPIQKDYLECLTKLHYHGLIEDMQDDLDNSSSINELDDQTSILTIDLYLSLEKKREEENDKIRKLEIEEFPILKMPSGLLRINKSQPDKTHIKNKLSIFAECEHIHNKAIFDGINEALNIYRPHSKKGEPLPWTGKASFQIDYTRTGISADEILSIVSNTLLDWNSFKVGPLPCREFYHNNIFDEEKFSDFREKKLAAILAYDVEKEDQEKWLDYESEESQVKLDLADIILYSLVEETIDVLNSIDDKRDSL